MDAERPDHREGMPRHVNLVPKCGISVQAGRKKVDIPSRAANL